MMQQAEQALAEAVTRLTAYAPELLAQNATRYPMVVMTTIALFGVFLGVAVAVGRWTLREARRTEDISVMACAGWVLIVITGVGALILLCTTADLLSYVQAPEVWALKDLLNAARTK